MTALTHIQMFSAAHMDKDFLSENPGGTVNVEDWVSESRLD